MHAAVETGPAIPARYTPRRLRSSSACSSTARSLSITFWALIANMVPQAAQRRRGDVWMVATVCAVFSPQRGQGILTNADGSMLYGMAGGYRIPRKKSIRVGATGATTGLQHATRALTRTANIRGQAGGRGR